MQSFTSKSFVRVLLMCLGLLCAAQLQAASKADNYVGEARSYLSKGDVKSAVIQLKNALQNDPGHIQARLMLGTIYSQQRNWPAAEKELGRAGQLGAEPKTWLLGYGRALLMQNRYLDVLEQVVATDDMEPAVKANLLALRGLAHHGRGDTAQAAAEFEAALQLQADNPMARIGRARLLVEDGKQDEALEQLNALIAQHPKNVEALLLRAELLRQVKKYELAKADFDTLVEVSPNLVQAQAGLGLTLIAMGKAEEAMTNVKAIRRVSKEAPIASYLHALVAFQKQDFATAADQLQQVLRVTPGHQQSQLLFGVVSYAQENYQLADEYLTRIHSSMANDLVVNKLLGAVRLKLKEPKRAIQVLEPLVPNHPDDAQLFALLGTAFMQVGDNNKGADYLSRSVEISPDQAMLRAQLAIGHLAGGHTGAAISELKAAVDLDQNLLQADVLLVLSYLQNNAFDKALEAAADMERRMPDSPIPYNLSGLAYMASAQHQKADEKFRTALQKDPNFTVAEMNLARHKIGLGKPEEAREHFLNVLAKKPDDMSALLGMASLAQANKDLKTQEQWLEQAVATNPKAIQPQLLLANLRLSQGEPLKAANLLSGLDEIQKQQPAVLRLSGLIELQRGEYSNAIRLFQQLVEKQPEYIEGWFQLARAQAASGDMGGSRSSFDKALELDKDHQYPLIWVGKGELELRAKRFEAALEVATKMQEFFPDNALAYELEGAAYRGMGDINKALQAIEKAVRAEGNSKRINLFAHTLSAAGRIPKAVYMLKDWLKENPKDAASWTTLGMMHQAMGDPDAALQAYETANKTGEEGNPVILNNIAWLYLDKGDPRAMDFARKAYDIAPERAEILDTYGWIMFKNGQQQQGLNHLQQAMVMAPKNPDIGMHVAEALHGVGRDAEARPIVESIIANHRHTKYEEPAKELLKRLQ